MTTPTMRQRHKRKPAKMTDRRRHASMDMKKSMESVDTERMWDGLCELWNAADFGGDRHNPDFVSLVMETAATSKINAANKSKVSAETEPDADNPREFARQYVNRDPAYSRTPAGLSAMMLEIWLQRHGDKLFAQFIETVLEEKARYLLLFDGRIAEQDMSKMVAQSNAFIKEFRLLTMAGVMNHDTGMVADLTIFEVFPAEGMKLPTKDKAQQKRTGGNRNPPPYVAPFDPGARPYQSTPDHIEQGPKTPLLAEAEKKITVGKGTQKFTVSAKGLKLDIWADDQDAAEKEFIFQAKSRSGHRLTPGMLRVQTTNPPREAIDHRELRESGLTRSPRGSWALLEAPTAGGPSQTIIVAEGASWAVGHALEAVTEMIDLLAGCYPPTLAEEQDRAIEHALAELGADEGSVVENAAELLGVLSESGVAERDDAIALRQTMRQIVEAKAVPKKGNDEEDPKAKKKSKDDDEEEEDPKAKAKDDADDEEKDPEPEAKKKAPPPPPKADAEDEEPETDDRMDDPEFYRDDLQAYYDLVRTSGVEEPRAITKLKQKFKIKKVTITPTGEVRSPGVVDRPQAEKPVPVPAGGGGEEEPAADFDDPPGADAGTDNTEAIAEVTAKDKSGNKHDVEVELDKDDGEYVAVIRGGKHTKMASGRERQAIRFMGTGATKAKAIAAVTKKLREGVDEISGATIGGGSFKPGKPPKDAVVLADDGDVRIWWSKSADVMHAIDIDSGFAIKTLKKIRDLAHAKQIAKKLLPESVAEARPWHAKAGGDKIKEIADAFRKGTDVQRYVSMMKADMVKVAAELGVKVLKSWPQDKMFKAIRDGAKGAGESIEEVAPIVKSWARKTGMAIKEATRRWTKAGGIVTKQYPEIAAESDEWYQLKVGVFRKMMSMTAAEAVSPRPGTIAEIYTAFAALDLDTVSFDEWIEDAFPEFIPHLNEWAPRDLHESDDRPKLSHDQVERYEKWKRVINMSAQDVRLFHKTHEATVSTSVGGFRAFALGQKSSKKLVAMKMKPAETWTDEDWNWAGRQLNTVRRLLQDKGELFDEGQPTEKLLLLRSWGHNPLRHTPIDEAEVIVRQRKRIDDVWVCPGCEQEIGEKELSYDGEWAHRPCGKPLVLPKLQDDLRRTANRLIDAVPGDGPRFVGDLSEYEAGVAPEFKTLKDNRVELSPDERGAVMQGKATWHHGPKGAPSPAVFKSEVNGKTWFTTNTHRAYNATTTLKGAIGRYHAFIKSTA